MTQSVNDGSTKPHNHDRLNGWKEIANHLGRSVRTAQRWEKDLGLPVRRIHTPNGEIVYASQSEIDTWLASTETLRQQNNDPTGESNGNHAQLNGESEGTAIPDTRIENSPVPASLASPPRARQWLFAPAFIATGLLIGMLLANVSPLGVLARLGIANRYSQPSTWQVKDGALLVFNEAGSLLWKKSFDAPLRDQAYSRKDGIRENSFVVIEDLDGNESKEVLLLLDDHKPTTLTSIFCFNADGSVRFEQSIHESKRYGGENFPPPYFYNMLYPGPPGAKYFWAAAHHNQWFPAVVQKISADGKILGEYWHNGHINLLKEAKLRGRDVLLVGAMNNDNFSGSLAVLDVAQPSGTAPALQDAYRCQNCPSGSPLAFLLFPQEEISRDQHYRPLVTEMKVDAGDKITLAVEEFSKVLALGESKTGAVVYYVLNEDLDVLYAETGNGYRTMHTFLEAQSRIQHRYSAKDEQQLFPVLRWRNGEMGQVAGPKPLHIAADRTRPQQTPESLFAAGAPIRKPSPR